jgi:hypothetical protein
MAKFSVNDEVYFRVGREVYYGTILSFNCSGKTTYTIKVGQCIHEDVSKESVYGKDKQVKFKRIYNILNGN